MIKAGFTGEMDPCTDPLKVLVGLGVSSIDNRVEPGAECKVVPQCLASDASEARSVQSGSS